MITTSFFLKDFITKKGNQVSAKLYDSNNPTANIRIGLKTKVFAECWNKEEQKAFMNHIYTKGEVNQINQELKDFEDSINKIKLTLELRNDPFSAERVKSLYDNDMQDIKEAIAKEDMVHRYIQDCYQPYALKFNFHSSPHVSWKSFIKFEEATKKRKVKDIGFNLLKEYAEYLKTVVGNKDSTIHTRIKKFKAFVNSELKFSAKIDPSYDKFKFTFAVTDKHRLTIEQFNTFFQIKDLPENLQTIKDWFIIMTCIGGIRIGSALVLDHDSFDRKNKTATYKEMKKTSGKVSSKNITNPLNEYALEILDKYNWKLPYLIEGQHFNEGLKEIIAVSDLNNEYFIIDEDGEKNVKKYLREDISSKCARKTFVSTNEDLGVNRTVSNAMSNHSSKDGNASDSYRSADKTKRWAMKLGVADRWNQEYYKAFPERMPKSKRQIATLSDGTQIVIFNNQIIARL